MTSLSFYFIMLRPFLLVKVRTSGQGDHCIILPGSARLAKSIATSLAMLTSKSKLKRPNKMIRNRCHIFWVDGGIHTENGWSFPSFFFWSGYLHQPQTYYNDSLKKLWVSGRQHFLCFSRKISSKLSVFYVSRIRPLSCYRVIALSTCAQCDNATIR